MMRRSINVPYSKILFLSHLLRHCVVNVFRVRINDIAGNAMRIFAPHCNRRANDTIRGARSFTRLSVPQRYIPPFYNVPTRPFQTFRCANIRRWNKVEIIRIIVQHAKARLLQIRHRCPMATPQLRDRKSVV